MKLNIEKVNQFTGHQGAIYSLCHGRSLRSFISAGSDGQVIEWDIDDPEEAKLLASSNETLFKVGLDKERQLLLFGNITGGLHWVNLEQKINSSNIIVHKKGLYAISQAGDRLLTGGGDGTLVSWDLEKQRSTESLKLSHKALRDMAVSPDGQWLVVAASDGAIYVLNAQTFEFAQQISGAHTNSVFAVTFTNDGQYLISGGRDAQIRIWDVEDKFNLTEQIPAHLYTVNRLRVNPGGTLLASASRDKTIKLWETSSFNLVKVIDYKKFQSHLNSVNDLLWISDTEFISCSDDRIIYHWRLSIINS